MNFLRWALIAAISGGFLLLSVSNWTIVPFVMPDGEPMAIALPVLLGVAFIAGWLPTWAWAVATRPRRPRAGAVANPLPKVARGPEPAPGTAGLCDQAQPTIVPPAGA